MSILTIFIGFNEISKYVRMYVYLLCLFSYGSPSGPVWVTSLSCGGSEKCLSSCLSSVPSSPGSCSGNRFATVACGEYLYFSY